MLVGFPPVVHLQSFLLTIKSDNTDGSMTIVESIPCEAGSSVEFCMVEVCAFALKKQTSGGVVVMK